MLKLEKNLFVEEIKTAGLDPALFTAVDVPPGTFGHATYSSGLEIKWLGTSLAFRTTKFDTSFDGRHYRCEATTFDAISEQIDDEFHERHLQGEYNLTAGGAAKCFGEWLRSDVALYFAERDALDMWREIRDMQSLAAPTLDDDEFFTEREKEYIRNDALPRIRLFILERFDPNENVLARIDKRLAYLAEAVDRPKFDFRGLLVAFVLSVATTLLLSKEDGTALIQFIADVMSSIGRLLPGG